MFKPILMLTLAAMTGYALLLPMGTRSIAAEEGGLDIKRAPLRNVVPKSTPAVEAIVSLGYYTGTQESFDALRTFAPYLTIVSADVFTIQPDGSIQGEDEFDAAAFDQDHDIQTYACVNNYNSDPQVDDFDAGLAHAALVTRRTAAISALVALAREGGYAGINVDFENLAFSPDIGDDRRAFSAFIHELAGRLHAAGKKLIISVPAKSEDSADNAWAYPFDLAALGKDADYLQLMTYDQHGPWSEPGPVSAADWTADCLAYAASLVEPSKLLIGLPAYGYNWDLSQTDAEAGKYAAESFPWKERPGLTALPGAETHWDATAQSPSVTYVVNGHRHEAWYENARSLRAKMALVKKFGLGGLSMWSLGQEDAGFWRAVSAGDR